MIDTITQCLLSDKFYIRFETPHHGWWDLRYWEATLGSTGRESELIVVYGKGNGWKRRLYKSLDYLEKTAPTLFRKGYVVSEYTTEDWRDI